MKKAIGAVLSHCSEASDLGIKHQMRPREADSWCKYQAIKQNNITTYKDKPGLSGTVGEVIKPIFMDLSNDELLKKYLHGKTQNIYIYKK